MFSKFLLLVCFFGASSALSLGVNIGVSLDVQELQFIKDLLEIVLPIDYLNQVKEIPAELKEKLESAPIAAILEELNETNSDIVELLEETKDKLIAKLEEVKSDLASKIAEILEKTDETLDEIESELKSLLEEVKSQGEEGLETIKELIDFLEDVLKSLIDGLKIGLHIEVSILGLDASVSL